MGFLTGSFLRIYSARRRLQLQNQLTSVTLRLERAQKQTAELQKQLTQMKQMQTNNITAMGNQYMQGIMGGGSAAMQSIFAKVQSGGSLTQDEQSQMSAYNQMASNAQAQASIFMSTQKNQIEMGFQMYEEAQLEPLKNLETNLTTEKANIESQLRVVEGQEEAAKKMADASKNDFVPEYTGN